MGINPWPVGDLAPLWTEAVLTDSGAEDLTGISDDQCQLLLQNISNGLVTTGTGTLHILTPSPAVVTYQPGLEDTNTPGLLAVKLVVTRDGGEDGPPLPQSYSLGVWEIVPFC